MASSVGFASSYRFVGWACEEFGGVGAQQYFDAHKANISNMDIVMETDMGVFRAQVSRLVRSADNPFMYSGAGLMCLQGLQFSGNAAAKSIVQKISTYLAKINATQVFDNAEGIVTAAPAVCEALPTSPVLFL